MGKGCPVAGEFEPQTRAVQRLCLTTETRELLLLQKHPAEVVTACHRLSPLVTGALLGGRPRSVSPRGTSFCNLPSCKARPAPRLRSKSKAGILSTKVGIPTLLQASGAGLGGRTVARFYLTGETMYAVHSFCTTL